MACAAASGAVQGPLLYVTNQNGASISVIDVERQEEVARVDLQALGFGPNAKAPRHRARARRLVLVRVADRREPDPQARSREPDRRAGRDGGAGPRRRAPDPRPPDRGPLDVGGEPAVLGCAHPALGHDAPRRGRDHLPAAARQRGPRPLGVQREPGREPDRGHRPGQRGRDARRPSRAHGPRHGGDGACRARRHDAAHAGRVRDRPDGRTMVAGGQISGS